MNEHRYGSRMTDAELVTFLVERGVGVLSLSRDGTSYGVPVSYGYDPDTDRCLLDLGFGPESRKRSFIETTTVACLTVFEWSSPTDWQSAVVTGTLRTVDTELNASMEELYYDFAKDIDISVFDRPPDDIELQWYEFEIEDRSGRRSRNSQSTG